MNLKAKLTTLWERICWSAWNYARKRAISRAQWVPAEAQDASSDATPDQRRIRANEARQVLENRHFIAAWDALNATIEAKALSCDTLTDEGKRQAAGIVSAKQLLHGLRREFERKLDDGYMAEAELDEIARRRQRLRFQR